LTTTRQPFNMQRMLHRGPYAVAEDRTQRPLEDRPLANWKRLLLGYDQNFTRGDRFLSAALFTWTMTFFAAFVIITAINLISPWSDRAWWRWVLLNNIALPIVIGFITTIWFTIGGVRDLRRLLHRLRTQPRNVLDDGTVTDRADHPGPSPATARAADELSPAAPTEPAAGS